MISLAKMITYSCFFFVVVFSYGTHCKRGVDRPERRVNYNGGFSLRGYFFKVE